MPCHESVQEFAVPKDRVFVLLRQTAVLVQLAPPEMNLRAESGPVELELGSRLVLRGRRWGVPQRIVSEVTAFKTDALLVLEQRQGPFPRWIHTQRLDTLGEGGTRLSERVDYVPPGGLLGLTVTAAFLERELTSLFAFRREKLVELLGCPVGGS
jgi:ligand-binding SRPBCC domain-containing protein